MKHKVHISVLYKYRIIVFDIWTNLNFVFQLGKQKISTKFDLQRMVWIIIKELTWNVYVLQWIRSGLEHTPSLYCQLQMLVKMHNNNIASGPSRDRVET
jgi:hypothetical protein